ncbi:MAG: RAMP superfamily CRISPR-associated protein [Spirulina sp.]
MEITQIPMMFRAQIPGRAQLQRLEPKADRQDADDWVEEWLEGMEEEPPTFPDSVETRDREIAWRMVSNSGQDETAIRPVLGKGGFPYYPGSSMKGAFLRACRQLGEDTLRYCGGKDANGEMRPGLLRFHGAYPVNETWRDRSALIDLVHPQQAWQMQGQEAHSAFLQISLYKPRLRFGISSRKALAAEEWETIWKIWRAALERGIGMRTSAGYGQTKRFGKSRLLSVPLQGQGMTSRRLDKTGEFRPNGFKATLRSHTLRLFGGLTDAKTAEVLTRELWGGFGGKTSVVGQVGVGFNAPPEDWEIVHHAYRRGGIPMYDIQEGMLQLLSADTNLKDKSRKNLQRLLRSLLKFALLLGGFGKSWRRADHRLVFPAYANNTNNPAIGCHWELWQDGKSWEQFAVPVEDLGDVTAFLDSLHRTLQNWLKYKKKKVREPAAWREAWHGDRLQVWGCLVPSLADSRAVRWLHGPYRGENEIKKSELTGKLNQIGRLWHRLYPRYLERDGELRSTGEYVELLTLFPHVDNRQERETIDRFLNFLQEDSPFSLLYGTG